MEKTASQFSTPILFIIFNRPDTTARVFQQIRAIKPAQLFVAADGPRSYKVGEQELCEQTRAIIKQVDWDCDVKTRFSEKNQGCKIGVSSAITWFFENVEEGIILEDDCLPDPSFFSFCETLLEKYRNDERIMHIGGVNFQDGKIWGNSSYYFSRLNHIWGWATWKRAWNLYDVRVQSFSSFRENGIFRNVFPDTYARTYWFKQFELVYTNRKDTWDVQWQYAMSIQNGLAILPNVNLVSNIGFDVNATHTIDRFNQLAGRPLASIETVEHPSAMVVSNDADAYTLRTYLHPNKMKKLWRLVQHMFR